ncbi:N-acetylmuramoyl-L-alanine amidase [Romboutsia sp.]|uniref:N-acetylmuramoyl-L-alanine amidase n=1 Tax=Romboutsia sp. TaxID=1965302 RepID=UPI002BDF154C|nr:N-acetylmuramoyl-L-alanine amidase [Romboutsia sp.]HSQ87396.1 N-acetylmuramoyl-L-alanine amidase [Romboutsia sp.]
MGRKINKAAKNIVACSMLATVPVLSNVSISNAGNSLELEFSSIADKYNPEDIIVENGVSIKKGETLDLSKNPGWEMSNDKTVKIDENGIVRPINEGTVFLSKEINEKVHIIEVHVSSSQIKLIASARMAAAVAPIATEIETPTVDRDYYKVFVDPGHGGNDNGASGFGYLEDELNLQVAKIVESKLKQKGIEVKMSRTSDVYLSLTQRANMANSYGADVFISIHQNAVDNESVSGIETYYHRDKAQYKPYSNEIQDNAIQETGVKDRGVKPSNYGVLRETTMPSSLFESGFISNKEESEKLADPVYQDKLASAIANGVETYLKENIILSGKPTDPQEKPPIGGVIKTGVVTATSLNVRSGYGTSYLRIGSLSKGTKVEVVESKNGWYKIKYKTGYGCVSADYIDLGGTESKPPTIPEEKPPVDGVIKTGVVNATSLNVRSGYGTSYSKIGSLSKGTKVEVVESKNGWYKIKYKTGYGCVSADYVNLDSTQSKPPTIPEVIKTGVVTATSLNVRSGYGTSYSKIGSLLKGTKVEVVESKNGWYKIKYKAGYGYVSGEYITL